MVYSIDKEVVLGRRKEEVAAMLQVYSEVISENVLINAFLEAKSITHRDHASSSKPPVW